MYIAMNRFKIALGREKEFEEIWRKRESYLDDVNGFQKFNLLHGPSNEEFTLFISHSEWDSVESFTDWTSSDNFKKAHSQARSPEGLHLSHPSFEGFEVVI